MSQEYNKSDMLKSSLLRSKFIGLVIFFSVLGVGMVLGWLLKGNNLSLESDQVINLHESGYEYISPLLDVESRLMTGRKDLVDLEKGIDTLISSLLTNISIDTNTNTISHISVYFKELSSGAWIGIDENEKFSPASLLKIPLMMAYYMMSETNPSYLDSKIKFAPSEGMTLLEQNIVPSITLVKGNTYSLQDLIRRMIIYSDNEAFALLLNYMKTQDQKKAYIDLGLQFPGENDSNDFMSVKEYASFFRVLYNASYLNKEMSSKALKLLTEVTFDKGLVAGVPKGIKVAHKFGERGYAFNNIKQLHDCGIVYYPKKPYLLCVMTRGNNLDNLEEAIAKVSKFVYQTVSR